MWLCSWETSTCFRMYWYPFTRRTHHQRRSQASNREYCCCYYVGICHCMLQDLSHPCLRSEILRSWLDGMAVFGWTGSLLKDHPLTPSHCSQLIAAETHTAPSYNK
jgi:hypothetical protein